MFVMLYLFAPMMSFGSEYGYFPGRRDTKSSPTESAILGMLGCMAGIKRGEDEKIDELRSHIAEIRCSEPTKTQRVYTHYNNAHLWKRNESNNTKYAYTPVLENGNVVNLQRRKDFLIEAKFLVTIHSNDTDFMERLVKILEYPKHYPYIGRSECIPAQMVRDYCYYDDSEYDRLLQEFYEDVNYDFVYRSERTNAQDDSSTTSEAGELPA